MTARNTSWTAALLLAAIPLGAAEPLPPLSWQDCVNIAVRRSPDLASSERAVEASRSSYRGSYNGFLPQISLSNSYNDNSGFTNSIHAGTPNHWQASAQASLTLYNASSVASIKSASAGLSQAQASLRQASGSVRSGLRQAYAQLLYAQEAIAVSKAVKDIRDRDAQLVKLSYESGRESKGNMLRTTALFRQAEADLAQAARNLRTAQKGLDRQLGLDEFTSVTATGTLYADAVPELPQDWEPLLAKRPDVAVSEAALQSSRASLSAARAPLLPSLSLNYSRSLADTGEFPTSNPGWTLGGVLSYPIFGGGPTAAYYGVSAASKSVAKAEQDLRSVRDGAVLDLENAWSAYASALDQVQVQEALLAAARQRNDEADVRYASGLLTFDNWELIVTDRVGTERQTLQARLGAVLAETAWEKSLGRQLGD